jgi:hypothetical protein
MTTQDAQDARRNLGNSAIGGKAIVNDVAIGLDTRAIYVGVAGNIVARMADGGVVTFSNVPVGIYPLSITMVVASGTTATNLVALY